MPRSTTPSKITEWSSAFQAGARHFNEGRFYEAHEEWEKDWRKIPDPDRAQVQAAILVCGVFVLIEKARFEPAQRLAALAVERFAEAAAQSKLLGFPPVLKILGAEECLLRIMAAFRVGEHDLQQLRGYAEVLRAELSQEEDLRWHI